MATTLKVSIPSANLIVKVAIAMLIVFLLVRLSPATWGIKQWFQPV